MKKILIIIVFTLTGFYSCKKDVTASDSKENVTTNVQISQLVVDEHLDSPGPYTLTNPCNGETVIVNGTIGIDKHTVTNGNTMNYSEQQRGQLTGTGNLGNTYNTNLNENIILNGISSKNGVFIINDVTIFRMVSVGEAPNFMVRRIAHLTVTSNGTVTVDRIDFETFCHG